MDCIREPWIECVPDLLRQPVVTGDFISGSSVRFVEQVEQESRSAPVLRGDSYPRVNYSGAAVD